jgi:hypothetical protein
MKLSTSVAALLVARAGLLGPLLAAALALAVVAAAAAAAVAAVPLLPGPVLTLIIEALLEAAL